MKTRYLGKCPVCEGDFKLNALVIIHQPAYSMVHHGYKRPGDGFIHGDCFAVNMPPYEQSCEPCKLYKTAVLPLKAKAESALQHLQSGTVESLWGEAYVPELRTYKPVEVFRATEPYKFEQLLKTKIRETERKIESLNDEIARMDKLIAAWVLSPVRTFEEEEAKVQVDRQARKAAKEEALQAKIAKKVAFYQGRIDSAFKKKKASSLTDLFESISRAAYDLKLTPQELFALVNRNAVWAFFGLVVHSERNLGGYRDDVNREVLTRMWKEGYWPTV